MNSKDYHQKMKKLLENAAYKPIDIDPIIAYLEKSEKNKIKITPIDLAIQKELHQDKSHQNILRSMAY